MSRLSGRNGLHLIIAGLLIATASLVAAIFTIVLFSGNPLFALPMLAALVFPLILYCSNNPRLFFLFGLAFTAPIQTSLNFLSQPHMGGAFALSINLVDFFLVPLIVFLVRDFYTGHRTELRFPRMSAWWLVLAALGVYSVVVGPFRRMSLFELVQMLKLFVLFLVIVNECVREKHFHWVVMGLCANMTVNIIVGLIQAILKRTLGLSALGEIPDDAAQGANYSVFLEVSDVFRVSGLAGHANLFGPYLGMFLPLMIGLQFTDYRPRIKVIAALLAVSGAACLVLTLSRSAWATFVLSTGTLMLALFLLPDLRNKYLTHKVTLLGGAIICGLVASGPILRRIFDSDPGAFNFRVEMVNIAFDMVRAHPALGVGLNTFDFHLPEFGPFSLRKLHEHFGDILPVVHNTYMIVWSEQGTVGLALFLSMHVNILWIAVQNLRYRALNERIHMISLCAACGVLGIMLDGFNSFFIKVHQFGRVFWIFVGLIVAARYWNIANAQQKLQAQPTPRAD